MFNVGNIKDQNIKICNLTKNVEVIKGSITIMFIFSYGCDVLLNLRCAILST